MKQYVIVMQQVNWDDEDGDAHEPFLVRVSDSIGERLEQFSGLFPDPNLDTEWYENSIFPVPDDIDLVDAINEGTIKHVDITFPIQIDGILSLWWE